jgi:exodeoxyribonuclease VII large subunit
VIQQYSLEFAPQRQIYTVAELNAAVREVLGSEFQDIWVSGEISGVKLAASGHYYFTLKEREAQIRCVCFRSTSRYLKFKPQDGIAVLARGNLDVFEARGEYQFIVEMLEPQGHGALQLAFEQLKKKLLAEGLFDPGRRRRLPLLPGRIGIVTSPQGAVIHDIIRILERRFPGLHIRLFPARVQGEGSVDDVCHGIEYFSHTKWADVLIVCRGGGSLEELWTFNEERVARAIANCAIPVIAAVGHETDVTIADFVADMRAPTPSAAAEMVVCTRDELLERIAGSRQKLGQALRYRIALLTRRLELQGVAQAASLLHRSIGRRMQQVDEHAYAIRESERRMVESRRRALQSLEVRLRYFDPRPQFARNRMRLESSAAAMRQAILWQCARSSAKLDALSAKLSQLSPLRVLERGYAIVVAQDGSIISDSAQAPAGSEIRVRLAAGRLRAQVTDNEP